MVRILFILIISIAISSFSKYPSQDLIFVWKDDFNTAEKVKVENWLEEISTGISKTFGKYPFPIKFYIHRRASKEPVPWAHTSRIGEQAVHFYIDTRYSIEEFKKDWTAPHEISHLSIPFIGKENMWFSEGYASYWQWQILKNQNIYTSNEMEEKYKYKLGVVLKNFRSNNTFQKLCSLHKSNYNFPALYWGGACYFLLVDEELKKKDSSLQEVIKLYQKDFRLQDESLEELIVSLDKVSNSSIFSSYLKKFQSITGKELINLIEESNQSFGS